MSHRPLLLLIDANALLHRAWHAIPPLKAPDGMVVNAVYGVTSVALKILKEEQPAVTIACWDTAVPTFRHDAYEAYKATRIEKEQELYNQIPICKSVLRTIGIPSIEFDGYEADDLIGTLATKGVEQGFHVRIVTGDKDELQLINDHVDVLTFKKGVTLTKLYDADAVIEEYGVTPQRLIDWKAIKGDTSDNIPGIPGIGEKGATDLLRTYGSLDRIFVAAHDASSDIASNLRKKLIDGEAQGRQAYDLVTIRTDVPIQQSFDDCTLSIDRDAFIDVAGKYGFRSLVSRLPGETKALSPAPAAKRRATTLGGHTMLLSAEDVFTWLNNFDVTEFVLDSISGKQGSLFGEGPEGIVIGTHGKSASIPTKLIQGSIQKKLRTIFEDESICKVCHDAKRQMMFLETVDIQLVGTCHDTLIAAYLLAEGDRRFDLESLVLQELGKTLPEGEERERMIVNAIYAICDAQRLKLQESKLDTILQRFELPLISILRDMERNGVKINVEMLRALSKEAKKEKEIIETKMERIVGHAFNPASPSQLAVILFEELKLPTKGIKKGKTGYSTAASELEKLEGTHEIIDLISQHREVAKLLSTYLDTIPALVDTNGRIHTTFNQAIAATGRLSSSEPNLQNIPIRTEFGRRIRGAFVAERGMELVACDYSQIELRVIAALSKDAKMLEAFRGGADIHTTTAAEIWGIDMKEVTSDQRRAAKAINFGVIYGQGPIGLSKTAGISFAEAKDFIDRYFLTYKGVRSFLDEMKLRAHHQGYVETLFGRRRYLTDIQSGMPALRAAAERMAINMPVQGTAADIMKLAMIEVAKGLASVSKGARMLLQVHDELLLEVPKKDVLHVGTFVRETMVRVADIGVPIVVDVKHGVNWQEMKALDASE